MSNSTSLDGLSREELGKLSAYNYLPSQTVAIIMLVLFGISTIAHTGQSVYYRRWFLLPTAVLCGVLELLGWAGRLWSYHQPLNFEPFQMQITCTIIAPTPLLAATFIIFGHIINRLGNMYSRLTPKQYMILFCTFDVVSLVVQGVGGGLAATASEENGRDPRTGGNIMLGGIAFQLLVIAVFFICAIEVIYRYLKDRPVPSAVPGERGTLTPKLKIMVGALALSTIVLLIRAIYRTIELADGWTGRIISTQVYFNVLDGAMVIIAIWLLNIFHPGVFLFPELGLRDSLKKPESRASSTA
ncbi:RTA1-like protein [Ephemerocybe angulata]|uniref:RTA1-like protein n=1 Tax=Ephemerocybe angulata TaxID=980116 RepID=A0A8H6LWW6_9AGAR|nr:RTA1-like protein [Tulosesus angulatus]